MEDTISYVMNLIGYGMAKFDHAFIREFGCKNNAEYAQLIVNLGFANTIRAVTNRRDSFDPYFDNGRRGWYQRNQREHIKLFIDSLFGQEDAKGFANIVKMYMHDTNANVQLTDFVTPPTTKSKFKQLQETGKEAEFYFMHHFRSIEYFQNAELEDARLWGDGYDFQLSVNSQYILAEVKGVREKVGSIRMTQNEYEKAQEFQNLYYLIVVSNLNNTPKLSCFQNPTAIFDLTKVSTKMTQYNYHSNSIVW